MKQLIACCDIDCENCDACIAPFADDDILREETAQKWRVMNEAPEIRFVQIKFGSPQAASRLIGCFGRT